MDRTAAPVLPRLTVRHVRVRGLNLVPDRPMETAVGTMAVTPLALIDVSTEEGITGRSYLRCYTPTALGPLVHLVANLGALIERTSAAPAVVAATLRRHVRLLGSAGLTGMALAGLDMAMWDANAKACGVPLATLLGGEPRPIPAYASLRTMRPGAAADEAAGAVADGFTAVKVKLGRADLAADLETVRAVRRAIGDSVTMMVDYNQCLSVTDAIERSRALAHEAGAPSTADPDPVAGLDAEPPPVTWAGSVSGGGIAWIEEPTDSSDVSGNARIRGCGGLPVQLGENWSRLREVAANIVAGSSDHVTLDVMRLGGVSGWLQAAALAAAAGLPASSHSFGEVSAHLLAVTPTAYWLEHLDHAAPVLAAPMQVEKGFAIVPARPGNGLDWNEDVIAPLVVHRA